MKYRFSIPTFDDVYLHLLVASFLFFFMNNVAAILSAEFFGTGFVFTPDNLKTIIPIFIFAALFLVGIYRKFPDFRSWIFIYSFTMLALRMFFF